QVTDISYVVSNEGKQTAAFNAAANVSAPGIHVYQLLINRAVPANTLIGCQPVEGKQAVGISVINGTPFSPNPFSPNPFSPNPFSPNPFSPNPFSPNPFSPNAFPSEFSNATFYLQPSASGAGTLTPPTPGKYVGDPRPDVLVVTIRDWYLGAGAPAAASSVSSFLVQ